jgi:hypothetical protein
MLRQGHSIASRPGKKRAGPKPCSNFLIRPGNPASYSFSGPAAGDRAFGLVLPRLGPRKSTFLMVLCDGVTLAQQISFVTRPAQFGGKNRCRAAIKWRSRTCELQRRLH